MKCFVSFALVAGLMVGCGDDKSGEPSNVGPAEGKPFTIPDLSMEMLWCPPGTFEMGSPKSEKGRLESLGIETDISAETQHKVTLTQGFWLGKHEVTQAQWEEVMGEYDVFIPALQAQWQEVMGTNPSKYKGANLPVERVSWDDATAFCKELTERERKAGRLPNGWAFALPTEAQWEYACRAGTKTAYSFGDTITEKQANVRGRSAPPRGFPLGRHVTDQTTDVGSYAANPWGFFDMHGNVWEWCSDWYSDYPTGAVTDPTGAASGSYRVQRGGSWGLTLAFHHTLRSAQRLCSRPAERAGSLGFRVGFKASQ